MLEWLGQNIYTILIIAALIALFALMIRNLIQNKKKGKTSCCGGCTGCANAAYCHRPAEEASENKEGSREEE